MIEKRYADKCITHFHACDCREYKFQELQKKADELYGCLSEMMNECPTIETIKKSLEILKEYKEVNKIKEGKGKNVR